MGAVALAMAAGIWAVAEQRTGQASSGGFLAVTRARARSAGARDALLAAGREALLVWGRDGSATHSYGGGDCLLNSCLAGPDATILSQALDALCDRGLVRLTARDRGRNAGLRGRAVGTMAAVWFEPDQAKTHALDFRAVLDALPIPVWLRDRTLSLVWGNRAFLRAVGRAGLEVASATQLSLDKSERDLASAARSEGHTLEAEASSRARAARARFTHTAAVHGVVISRIGHQRCRPCSKCRRRSCEQNCSMPMPIH